MMWRKERLTSSNAFVTLHKSKRSYSTVLKSKRKNINAKKNQSKKSCSGHSSVPFYSFSKGTGKHGAAERLGNYLHIHKQEEKRHITINCGLYFIRLSVRCGLTCEGRASVR